jgi:hypothetical protein
MHDARTTIEKFAGFCKHYLKLKTLPDIKIVDDPDWAYEHGTFGMYLPGKDIFYICIADRHPMDVLRTVGHELVHHKQREENVDSAPRDIIEIQANRVGSMLIKVFSRHYPEYFRD